MKAIKCEQNIQEKEKDAEKKEKLSFDEFGEYKQTLGRSVYSKNTDYSKTCLHNPKIVEESRKNQQNGIVFIYYSLLKGTHGCRSPQIKIRIKEAEDQ